MKSSSISGIAAGAAMLAALGAGAYMMSGKGKKAMSKTKFKKNAGKAVRAISDFVGDMSAIMK